MKKKYIAIAISLLIIGAIVSFGLIFQIKYVVVVFENHTEVTGEEQILKLSEVTEVNNIFSVDEDAVKKKISTHYSDLSVYVTDVVRVFPNRVEIHVKERIPIFKISITDSDKLVPTDKDFQRHGTYASDEVNFQLIEVNGFSVKNTFDLEICRELRTIAYSLIEQGVEEEALTAFIESITVDGDIYRIKLRGKNANWTIKKAFLESDISLIFAHYKNLSNQERQNCDLSAAFLAFS